MTREALKEAGRPRKKFSDLLEAVVSRGLCAGCGTCVGLCPHQVLDYDRDHLAPVLSGQCKGCGICLEGCPGAELPLKEIQKAIYGRVMPAGTPHGQIISSYKACARDPAVRNHGASGGLGAGIAMYLLRTGIADCVITAGSSKDRPWRFEPVLITGEEQVIGATKSKYVVIPVNALILKAKLAGFKKAALIGLPCHIQGVRKAMLSRPKLLNHVKFTVGLFCGTNWPPVIVERLLRTAFGLENIEEVARFEFRAGQGNQSTAVTLKNGKQLLIGNEKFLGSVNSYRRDRCLVCTDFAAELADIAIGDIFTPESTKIPGWNHALARTSIGHRLFEQMLRDKWLMADAVDESILNLNRGCESKKYASPYRIDQRKKYGWPVPETI